MKGKFNMKDWYKVRVINECLDRMKNDEYYLARLKGDDTKAINIDVDGLMLLRMYYNGEIMFHDNPATGKPGIIQYT